MNDRIELGQVAHAAGRRDGRPGAQGRVVEAVSADRVWHFYVDGPLWSVEHLPSGRVLPAASTSLRGAASSESWLLAELDQWGVAA